MTHIQLVCDVTRLSLWDVFKRLIIVWLFLWLYFDANHSKLKKKEEGKEKLFTCILYDWRHLWGGDIFVCAIIISHHQHTHTHTHTDKHHHISSILLYQTLLPRKRHSTKENYFIVKSRQAVTRSLFCIFKKKISFLFSFFSIKISYFINICIHSDFLTGNSAVWSDDSLSPKHHHLLPSQKKTSKSSPD